MPLKRYDRGAPEEEPPDNWLDRLADRFGQWWAYDFVPWLKKTFLGSDDGPDGPTPA